MSQSIQHIISSTKMFEGYGGPIQMNQTDLSKIDPTLAACCQREVSEMN